MKRFVPAQPYAWPFDGNVQPTNTAFVVIDMQVDFCGKGGYVDLMGYDLNLTRAPIEPIRKVMEVCRQYGYPVIHTREGHRTGLDDLPENKKWRSEKIGAGIGTRGPAGRVLVRGEPGWEIISELAPLADEVVIDKPGKGSFYATDLELVLRTKGIRNIILAGITTDVCVHTTMRDANDKGFECLILSDCTAATDPGNHQAALKMVTMQGGVFGAVSSSDALIPVLMPPVAAMKTLPSAAQPHSANSTAANGTADIVTVKARPCGYTMQPSHTALVMIDFQKDFMEPGGFGATLMGPEKVAMLKECVPGAVALLSACRAAGMKVVHTLEAHKPDLSDLPASKWSRGSPALRIGDAGPHGRILIRGEPGNGIIDELAPIEGEKSLFKPGKGMFYATDIDTWLRSEGITHLLFAGVTTEICVTTSMREANDRGYECLLVTDATASFFPHFKEAAIEMTVAQDGIIGWAAPSSEVIAALPYATK